MKRRRRNDLPVRLAFGCCSLTDVESANAHASTAINTHRRKKELMVTPVETKLEAYLRAMRRILTRGKGTRGNLVSTRNSEVYTKLRRRKSALYRISFRLLLQILPYLTYFRL